MREVLRAVLSASLVSALCRSHAPRILLEPISSSSPQPPGQWARGLPSVEGLEHQGLKFKGKVIEGLRAEVLGPETPAAQQLVDSEVARTPENGADGAERFRGRTAEVELRALHWGSRLQEVEWVWGEGVQISDGEGLESPMRFGAVKGLRGRALQQYLRSTNPASAADSLEAKRQSTEGGCVLELAAVINRGCAMISETLPVFYIEVNNEEQTKEIKVNETATQTTIKWVCWGDTWEDPFPEVNHASFPVFVVGLGMKGMITACALDNLNKILCFGSNDATVSQEGDILKGQAQPPEGKFKQLAVGGLHSCAIVLDDATLDSVGQSLACWGNDRMRQSDVPKIIQQSVLIRIDYIYVQAGYEHTCALRSDNKLTCFGSDFDSQIDIPEKELATEEKDGGYISVKGSYGCCTDCTQCDCSTTLYAGVGSRCKNEMRLSLGWYHTCAIRAGCDVQCIDNNAKCNSGSITNWYDQGSDCFCSTCSRPHELECWGYNAYGNVDIPSGQFKQVVASYDFTCAVYAECNGKDIVDNIVPGTRDSQCTLANTIVCFGRNQKGQVSPPEDLCSGADKARLEAESRLNNTLFATPPPTTEAPQCICTPQGCDCKGQMPRLSFDSGSTLSPSLLACLLSAMTGLIAGQLMVTS